MKYLLLILINIPIVCVSQEYLVEFDRYNSTYDFDWRGFESNDEYENKLKFVDFAQKNNLLEGERMMLKQQENELRFNLKSVDINNDNVSDIIYSGPWGGEGNVVHFFIQDESGYRNIKTFRQGIIKVDWNNTIMNKIYIHDWGCCADPTLTNQVYQVTYLNNIPQFELIWESIELEEFTAKPKNHFEKPYRFEVTNDIYKLRGQPYIDDTTKNYHLNITGNTIGILKKGFKGTAYASSVDVTGRTWWYVTIDPIYKLEETYINYAYHEFDTHLIGWISSRYVNKIEEIE